MKGFWAELERLGKDRNPYRAGFLQFVGVAETHEEALKLYKEPAEYFYERCLHVDSRFATPPGYTTEATIRAGIESQIGKASQQFGAEVQKVRKNARSFEDILEAGYVIVGTPDEVAAKLREVAVNLHVGHLMLLLQFGNMSKQLTMHNTKLFAEQVMPQLKDLIEEWEDRWWPNPMPAAERTLPQAFSPRAAV